MKFRPLLVCAAHLAIAISHAGAQTAPDPSAIRIQLLNGKTGRPIAAKHLLISPERDGSKATEYTTDGEGFLTITPSSKDIEVWVDWYQPCSKTGRRDFAVTDIRAAGIVSENSCKPRITLFRQPGTLIFFLREETFFEKMRH